MEISGATFKSTPDKDGDSVEAVASLTRITVKIRNADGDFTMAYLDRADAAALAQWILAQ